MTPDRNADVVRRALEDFGRRDLEALGALLADDVAWVTPGVNVLSGEYHGRAQVVAYLRDAIRLTTGTIQVRPVDLCVGRDHVAAVVDVSGERDGRSLRDRSIQLFRLRDGLIVERRIYPADQRATDAFWGSADPR